jgi:iron-sulfur cluster assembly protein
MQETSKMAVILTPSAAKEVQRVLSEGGYPESTMLRIRVTGGGCSGLQQSLGFDDHADEEQDVLTEQHGVRIAVDKKSDLFIDGTTIDFYEGIDRRGFVINNPQAKRTCGCGSSFSV